MQSTNETIRLNVLGENLVPKSTGEGAEAGEEARGTTDEGTVEAADNGAGSRRRRKRKCYGCDGRRNGELRRRRDGRDAGRSDAGQRRRLLFIDGHADAYIAGSTSPVIVARVDVRSTIHIIRATFATRTFAALTAILIAALISFATCIFICVYASVITTVGNNSFEYSAQSTALHTVIQSNPTVSSVEREECYIILGRMNGLINGNSSEQR